MRRGSKHVLKYTLVSSSSCLAKLIRYQQFLNFLYRQHDIIIHVVIICASYIHGLTNSGSPIELTVSIGAIKVQERYMHMGLHCKFSVRPDTGDFSSEIIVIV